MHFHLTSFLLGLLCGILLIVLSISFLIYLILHLSVRDDEKLFNRQRLLVDSYPYEDHSLK
jgi:hypothetical protein